MSLAKKYSKEILKRFEEIPVYMPGTEVRAGDIISFGTNVFDRANRPFGSFAIMGNLTSKNINFGVVTDKYPKEINFVSSKSINVEVAVAGEYPNVVEGDVKFTFNEENSFLLYGLNGRESKIEDWFKVRDQLRITKDKEDWNDFYIVTSVMICEKALIYAAEEKGGQLIISAKGNIGIDHSQLVNIDASGLFSVKKKTKAIFSKDWEENITVLMKLAQFKKNELDGIKKDMLITDDKLNTGNPAVWEIIDAKSLIE